MAKNETNVSQWVDERLAGLDAGDDWRPDAASGLARLRERRRAARRRRVEWVMASVAGLAACAFLLVFFSPGACARPRGCSSDLTSSVGPNVAVPPSAPANFKETGSPTAPIVCEIYTDYECPSCAMLYKDVVPLLTQEYVATGKVRLLHRDFPLPQHRYARLAARYANAAGTVGEYQKVVDQLFRTQDAWNAKGNVDVQVAQVLTPSVMERVRALVAQDAHLDDTVTRDVDMGLSDHLNQTPTLVIVAGGRRQVIAGVPPYSMLQSYLDQLLSRR